MTEIRIVHIKSSRNNFFIIISDSKGKVLFSKNAGSIGFKNNLKRTVEALNKLLIEAVQFSANQRKLNFFFKLDALDAKMLEILYKQTINNFKKLNIQILGFKIINKIPHNGCRNKK